MNSMRKMSAILIVTCLIYLGCGCVSPYLVKKWQYTTFKSPPISKVLVVYVTENAVQRRIWEDAFTGALSKNTLSAVSSYGLFPDAPPDTGQIMEVLKTNGFNGMVVIMKGKFATTVKPVVQMIPYGGRNRMSSEVKRHSENYSYWPRYHTCYLRICYPGYIESQTIDLHTIDVIITGKIARLIWSAIGKTPDPVSGSYEQGEIAGLVVDDLVQQHIIGFNN